MASFALGRRRTSSDVIKSEPWRNAMMEAFNKYIVNGPRVSQSYLRQYFSGPEVLVKSSAKVLLSSSDDQTAAEA